MLLLERGSCSAKYLAFLYDYEHQQRHEEIGGQKMNARRDAILFSHLTIQPLHQVQIPNSVPILITLLYTGIREPEINILVSHFKGPQRQRRKKETTFGSLIKTVAILDLLASSNNCCQSNNEQKNLLQATDNNLRIGQL